MEAGILKFGLEIFWTGRGGGTGAPIDKVR